MTLSHAAALALLVARLTNPADAGPAEAVAPRAVQPEAVQSDAVASRAEAWQQRRRGKAEELSPPQRPSVEAGLYWLEANYIVERIQAGWHSFHPVFGGLPTGSGLGLGFRFIDEAVGTIWIDEDAPNRVDVAFGAVGSFKSYALVDGEVALRNLGGAPLNARLAALYRNYPQEDFFGIGPDSREADRTTFLLRAADLGVDVWWQRPGWLRIGGGAAIIDADTGRGTDSRFPSIEETFTGLEAPGLGSDLSFLRNRAFVEVDWRDAEFNPRSGGYYAFRANWYDERGSAPFDFRQ